jgi:peptidoglycan/LPS O-acetylase OafA/YrhL
MPDRDLAVSSTKLSFRPDIQGLRAVAVALVILAHVGVAGFAGGYVGVDVFFVLSGYLITGLLLEERVATGTIRYGEFLARRLRRLLPAMLAMLLVVLIVSTIVLTPFEMRQQSRSFPYAAAWISNFFFSFAERDYFLALQDHDLFLHTWSLGVEEQFYLIWPWLVLLFVGFKARVADRLSQGKVILVGFAMVFVASLVLSIYLSANLPLLAFYMMPSRFWQFALGSGVYVGMHMAFDWRAVSMGRKGKIGAWIAGLTGVMLVICSAVLLSPDISYPGWYALAPSFGAALLIAAGRISDRAAAGPILSSGLFVWIGDRSYSLYLWHWPILILGTATGISGLVAGKLVLVALTVALAMLSYRYIELPFWKGRFRTAIPKHVVVYAVTTIIVSVTAYNALERQVFGSSVESLVADGYDPRMDADPRVYLSGLHCDTGHFATQVVPCALGNPTGERLAVLLGDSIGVQWSPAVSEVFPSPEWQILVLTKSACAIVDKTWHYNKAGGDYTVCTEWRNMVLDYIDMIAPDVLIIGSSATYNFTATDWVDGTTRVLQRVAPSVGHVVLIAGTPHLSFDGPSCLEDPWRFSFRLINGDRECEEAMTETRSDVVANYLRQSASGFVNVGVVELGGLVCPDGRCAAQTTDGVVIFRDEKHITASFARSLVPLFKNRLEVLGVSPAQPESDMIVR